MFLLAVATPPPADAVSRLRADISFLASDALGGRDTGSPQVALAEEHVEARFRALKLEPLPGRNSLYVPFELERDAFDRACTHAEIHLPGRTVTLLPEADFRPFDFSNDGQADAPLVFAGYGITAPELKWDDYAGLDVTGKAVLVLRHEPRESDPSSPFDGVETTAHASFASKAENARKHGAVAMLVVTDPLHHEPADDLRWGGGLRLKTAKTPAPRRAPATAAAPASEEPAEAPLLAIQVSRSSAARLLTAPGVTLASLQMAVDEGASPASLAPPLGSVRLAVHRGSDPETVHARNVAGVLPGSDPAVADQWIVVGAHHDHVGMFAGEGDTIFNGADDNASGTSAVLELARRFAESPQRPRRTLVFVTFSAEEKGLYGSKALLSGGALPRERLAFMLNNDMLGRNPDRPIEAVGDGYTTGMRSRIETAAEGLGLSLQYAGDGYFGASDHEPFYEADVPFLFFFTGTHEDYHQVGDHVEKIDFERLGKLVDLEERLLLQLASAEDAPRFVHHVSWLGAKAEIREASDGRERAVITGLEDGSRGHQQGLRQGDAVLAFGDKDLADPAGVGAAFRAIEPGASSKIALLRDGRRVELDIERAKPGWLGVFPGAIEAEARKTLGLRDDEGLLLANVVADGPAAKSGLKSGDVLVQLAGKPINQRLLSSRLAQIGAGVTVPASIYRDGKPLEIPLTLGERPAR